MPTSTTRPTFADLLFLSLLIVYVFAGMMLAPFHGDEATTIYQSKDWYRITSLHDLPTVFFRPQIDDPRQADEQEFRLQNGVTSKYAIGLMASLLGQPIDAMNDPWFWGADYNDNLAHAHLPKPIVLLAARFSSTAMLALSVAFTFRIGWLLVRCTYRRGRSAAWVGAFIYATLPAVLLNGRRAMFEGATLLVISLVIERGLVVTLHLRASSDARKLWINYTLLGLACGVGVATKHSLLIIVVPVLGMLVLLGWSLRTLRGVVIAGVIALATFLTLNPAWWTAPLTVPREVLRLRQGVLQAQVDIFGGYQNTSDRIVALVRYPLGTAQYFEDKQNWNVWIGDQIAAYEASRLGGINWNGFGLLTYAVIAIGVFALLMSRQPMGLLFVGVLAFDALALVIATPLPWQRYYLLLAAPLAIAAGVGIDAVREFAVKRFTA